MGDEYESISRASNNFNDTLSVITRILSSSHRRNKEKKASFLSFTSFGQLEGIQNKRAQVTKICRNQWLIQIHRHCQRYPSNWSIEFSIIFTPKIFWCRPIRSVRDGSQSLILTNRTRQNSLDATAFSIRRLVPMLRAAQYVSVAEIVCRSR